MRSNWFVVIRVREDWWIDNEGKAFGPFASREAACAASSRIARAFGDPKRRTLVYWPDDAGKQCLMFDGV